MPDEGDFILSSQQELNRGMPDDNRFPAHWPQEHFRLRSFPKLVLQSLARIPMNQVELPVIHFNIQGNRETFQKAQDAPTLLPVTVLYQLDVRWASPIQLP